MADWAEWNGDEVGTGRKASEWQHVSGGTAARRSDGGGWCVEFLRDPTVWALLWIDPNHVSGFRQIGLKLQHF